MKRTGFHLEPHPAANVRPRVRVNGEISANSGRFWVDFQISGCLEEVLIPNPSEIPARKHGLWEETCFELFLGVRNSDQYWEFNFSPAGHWNVYRFRAYRQGMQEESAFSSLPVIIANRADLFLLSANFDFSICIREFTQLEAALTAVLELREGGLTHWAMAHDGSRPDFHRRDGFKIKL